MQETAASTLLASQSGPLKGALRVPSDKSMSHRALMFAASALGTSHISNLLEGEDVLNTAKAMAALGAIVKQSGPGTWEVSGCGVGGFKSPEDVIDFGNSGTGVRLAMGLIGGQPIRAVMTGDASLRRRPMARVMTPLEAMGIRFEASEGGRLPLTVIGPSDLLPISYRLPVASAQVKSAVLLAGLNAPGRTEVIEPEPTRDHSERMLRHFGAEVRVEDRDDGRHIFLEGQPELRAADVLVPADPSSAAFPLVAALICGGSDLLLREVGTNSLRTGLFTTLQEMGAQITLENPREASGEPIADLRVKASKLKAIEVPAERAPSMIDEYPILAMAAACAEGRTVMRGLAELRVKESDRLGAVARGLAACGVKVEEGEDWLAVEGAGPQGLPKGGGQIDADLDHRIAMAFLVLGLVSQEPIAVTGCEAIETSFPGFRNMMTGLGAAIQEETA